MSEQIKPQSSSDSLLNLQEELESKRQIAIESKDYLLADQLTKQLQSLLKTSQNKSNENLIHAYQQTLQILESNYSEELNSLLQSYANRENELTNQLIAKEEVLKQKHNQDINSLYTKFKDESNYKPSAQFLQLKRIEENLVKQNRFLEANQIKLEMQQLVNDEVKHKKYELEIKINKTIEKMLKQHAIEKENFKDEVKMYFENLNAVKENEIEKLNLKYKNKKKDLDKQIRYNKKENGFLYINTNNTQNNNIMNNNNNISVNPSEHNLSKCKSQISMSTTKPKHKQTYHKHIITDNNDPQIQIKKLREMTKHKRNKSSNVF